MLSRRLFQSARNGLHFTFKPSHTPSFGMSIRWLASKVKNNNDSSKDQPQHFQQGSKGKKSYKPKTNIQNLVKSSSLEHLSTTSFASTGSESLTNLSGKDSSSNSNSGINSGNDNSSSNSDSSENSGISGGAGGSGNSGDSAIMSRRIKMKTKNLVRDPRKFSSYLVYLAGKTKESDAVLNDLDKFINIYYQSPIFRSIFRGPAIKAKDKGQVISQILDKFQMSNTGRWAITTLIDYSRLSSIKRVSKEYQRILRSTNKQITVTLTTANQLTPNQLQLFQDKISPLLPKSCTMVIDTLVNPGLIGGFKIKVQNSELDMSVDTKIKKFQKVLKSTVTL